MKVGDQIPLNSKRRNSTNAGVKQVFLVRHDASYIVFTLGIYHKKDKADGSLRPPVCLFAYFLGIFACMLP